MSVQSDKLPPVPQLVSPLTAMRAGDWELRDLRFESSWLQWFVQVKAKVDTINAAVVSFGNIGTGTGLVVQDPNGVFLDRTITGTVARISVSNGDGAAGNPTIDIDAAYVGQTSITTLGTVSTGTWNASTIALNRGGTGATTASGARGNLGLGSAAVENIGTSGATVPLLSTANTYTLTQTYTQPHAFTVGNITDAADDTAAASAGVAVGGMYRTGSILKVRVT